MAKKQVKLMLDETDIANLKAKLGGKERQAYLEGLIKQDLYGKIEPEKDVVTNLKKLETDAQMDKILDAALLQKMSLDPMAILDGLDSKQLAELMVKRMPKPQQADTDLENQAISLRECLAELPNMTDVTKELSKTKGKLAKSCFEYELLKKSVQVLSGKLAKVDSWAPLKALFDEAARYVNCYGRDCDARGLDMTPLRILAIKTGVAKEYEE